MDFRSETPPLPEHVQHLAAVGGTFLARPDGLPDALRNDARLRDGYAALKLALADRYPRDREAYIEAKTDFVTGVLARI